MKFLLSLFLLLIVVLGFGLPEAATAQGFLPCDGSPGNPCNSCHIVVVANLMISWLIGAVMVLFAVLMVIAGFRLVTSQGNPDALNNAKSKFTNAIIGLLIVLSAWLIVDTLMRGVLGGNGEIRGYGPWSEIQCTYIIIPDVVADEVGIQGAPLIPTATCNPTNPDFPNCGLESVGGQAVPEGNLESYQNRLFDAGVIDRVRALHAAVPGLRLSGGHRTPERNQEVNGSATSYHLSGRAADFVGSQADMQAGADWARANGAVEVLVHNAGSGTHLHVAF